MKIKKGNKIMIIILVIMLIGVAYFIIKNPRVQSYFYSGDRITLKLKVNLNGKEVSLENIDASCFYNNEKCEVASENGVYKTPGGKHGLYQFQLYLSQERLNGFNKDISFNFNYINANEWYISNSECEVELFSNEEGGLSGHAIAKVEYNDKSSENYRTEIELNENIINVNWGL